MPTNSSNRGKFNHGWTRMDTDFPKADTPGLPWTEAKGNIIWKMQPRFRRPLIVAAVLAALLAMAGGGWWFCARSSSTAFLPASPGAEWIIDSAPPENMARKALSKRAIFNYTFALATPPASATLTFRAFKNAAVSINGQAVADFKRAGRSWKLPAEASVAVLLHAGTNDITVCVT